MTTWIDISLQLSHYPHKFVSQWRNIVLYGVLSWIASRIWCLLQKNINKWIKTRTPPRREATHNPRWEHNVRDIRRRSRRRSRIMEKNSDQRSTKRVAFIHPTPSTKVLRSAVTQRNNTPEVNDDNKNAAKKYRHRKNYNKCILGHGKRSFYEVSSCSWFSEEERRGRVSSRL